MLPRTERALERLELAAVRWPTRHHRHSRSGRRSAALEAGQGRSGIRLGSSCHRREGAGQGRKGHSRRRRRHQGPAAADGRRLIVGSTTTEMVRTVKAQVLIVR